MPHRRNILLFGFGVAALFAGVLIGKNLNHEKRAYSVTNTCVPEGSLIAVDKFVRKMSGNTKRYSDDVYELSDIIDRMSVSDFSKKVANLGYVFDEEA